LSAGETTSLPTAQPGGAAAGVCAAPDPDEHVEEEELSCAAVGLMRSIPMMSYSYSSLLPLESCCLLSSF
jgi:hypothetical protein